MGAISKNGMEMIDIQLKKILKSSSGEMLLNVQASLEEGKFTTVYGKSGAGKSTLLMLLAGLIKPDEGFLSVAGKTVYRCNISTGRAYFRTR